MPESMKNSVQNNIEHNGHLHAVKDMETVSPEIAKITKEIEHLEEQRKIASSIGGGTPDIDKDIEKLMEERRRIAEGTVLQNEARIHEIQEKIANLEEQQNISKRVGSKDPLIEKDLEELNKELKKLGWTEDMSKDQKSATVPEYNPQMKVVHSAPAIEKKISTPKTRKEELEGIVNKRISEINEKDTEKYPGATPEEVKAKKQEIVDKRIQEIKAGIVSSSGVENDLAGEGKKTIEAKKLLDKARDDYEKAMKKAIEAKKSRTFFSKVFGGGESARLAKIAQGMRAIYKKAILQFGSIMYFNKEQELKNMQKEGLMEKDDHEKTLDAYKKKEIKKVIEKEEAEMMRIDKTINA